MITNLSLNLNIKFCSRQKEYFHYYSNTEHGVPARFVLCEQQFRTNLGSGVAWVILGTEVTPPALGLDPRSPPSLETEMRLRLIHLSHQHQHLSLGASRQIKKVSTVIDETLLMFKLCVLSRIRTSTWKVKQLTVFNK